jgi:DNA-directed RNA polymerase specialized sigma24 family protein
MTFTSWEMAQARKVAYRQARRWGVDAEDLHGDLCVWLCDSYKYVEAYRTDPAGRAKLVASMHRRANTCARREHEARVVTPAVVRDCVDSHYTTEQVEAVLSAMGAMEDFGEIGEEVWVMVADINGAYQGLRAEEKTLLFRRYGQGVPYEALAEEQGLTKDALRMRVNRAVERLRVRSSQSAGGRLAKTGRGAGPD